MLYSGRSLSPVGTTERLVTSADDGTSGGQAAPSSLSTSGSEDTARQNTTANHQYGQHQQRVSNEHVHASLWINSITPTSPKLPRNFSENKRRRLVSDLSRRSFGESNELDMSSSFPSFGEVSNKSASAASLKLHRDVSDLSRGSFGEVATSHGNPCNIIFLNIIFFIKRVFFSERSDDFPLALKGQFVRQLFAR